MAEVVGIDADYDAIRLARRALRRRGVGNVRCERRAISDLTLASVGVDERFDIVYSMDVVEHLPRPEELLERTVTVIRPGGFVLIGTPKFLGEGLMSPYHVREFTRDELIDLVAPWITVEDVHELPMRRILTTSGADVFHDDGFVVVAGRPR